MVMTVVVGLEKEAEDSGGGLLANVPLIVAGWVDAECPGGYGGPVTPVVRGNPVGVFPSVEVEVSEQ